jgi:hypothetical protein
MHPAGTGELAPCDQNVRRITSAGIKNLLDILALAAERTEDKPSGPKRKALVDLSAMVGAIVLSRIVTDAHLSDSFLIETTKQLKGSGAR